MARLVLVLLGPGGQAAQDQLPHPGGARSVSCALLAQSRSHCAILH